MAVPAVASELTTVSSESELKQALQYAQQRGIPSLIIGGGSNTLFKQDYRGLVIHNRILGIDLLEQSASDVVVRVAAGENWHEWVAHCLAHEWFGLENLALIPGLVGAAPMQNIGAYGVELKDTVHTVEYLDSENCEPHCLTNSECQFDYRDSIFKHALAGQATITQVNFRLSKRFSPELSYPALSQVLQAKHQPTARDVFDAVCALRNQKLPLPSTIPNSGSFFKNPIVSPAQLAELHVQYPDIVSFEHGDNIKLAAAWMIEHAGWKNRQFDGVSVHQQQALVVTNPNKRPGSSVLHLAKQIQTDIKQKFMVELEFEPQVY